MVSAPPDPPHDPAVPPPTGAPLSVHFDGILDGRVVDAPALQAAAEALSQLGGGTFQVDIDGGRFSLLPAGEELPGDRFDEAAQARFVKLLGDVLAAAAPGSVEATLRCRLGYPEQIVETWFRAGRAGIEPLSRVRPRTAEDGAFAAPTAATRPPLGIGRRELLILAPLLLVAGLLYFWQAGLLDRMLSARAEQIRFDTGPFGSMLDVAIERSWGQYEVRLRRGPAYPADPAAVQQAQTTAAGLPQRAAAELVGNGGELWLQMRDVEGKVLDAVPVQLRALLVAAEGEVKARLPGRMQAQTVALSLTREAPKAH